MYVYINTFQMIVGALFETTASNNLSATAYYNTLPFHALPISVSLLLNGLAKTLGSAYSISTSMLPLPKDPVSEAKDQGAVNNLQGFLVGFCISFGMAFLTSSFVFFLVKEREVRGQILLTFETSFRSGTFKFNHKY